MRLRQRKSKREAAAVRKKSVRALVENLQIRE
jgi:hypothetical protein